VKQDWSALYRAIGYEFIDQELLLLALTHRSFNGHKNNERLEFLGDCLLNAVIGIRLFEQLPHFREGQLSRLRANLVKEETLAELAIEFSLGRYLRLGPGELKAGGRQRVSVLADAVEALIGAIYQEAGLDLCRQRILHWYATRLTDLRPLDAIKDNKTRLQELMQARRLPLPEYEVVGIQGDEHSQWFKVTCKVEIVPDALLGEGANRRQAEQQAAGKILEIILKGNRA
jgi:ribonuclease-3